jgi:glutathione S-transferase
MLKLCGFAGSNYHNKAKFALLEKGVPFTEELTKVGPWAVQGLSDRTPFGKVPFLETEHGNICESQAILAYLEARYPTPALLPADAWQAAKVHELITCMELHLELVAREFIPSLYFGAPAMSDNAKARVHKQLTKNVAGFKRLTAHTPITTGEAQFALSKQLTQADLAAYVHLPLVALTSKLAFGEDMLAAAGINWKPYVKFIGERPAALQVDNDRKSYQAALQARS